MATQIQITMLRNRISEPDNVEPYTDEALAEMIDELGSIGKTASEIWKIKAGELSTLVDISEGGSSRKNSDAYKAALAMAQVYDDTPAPETGPEARRATTRPIVRG